MAGVFTLYGGDTYGDGVYGGDTITTAVLSEQPATHVRERPRLGLHIDVETPTGLHYRWGEDEARPANVPHDLQFSTVMPGGFDSLDVTLPRRPGIAYSDLDRLSTLRVFGAGGESAGEYRLERAPRTSGDEMSVSPGAVGWQAHLEDDKSILVVIQDMDLSSWGDPSSQRRKNLSDGALSSNNVQIENGLGQDAGATAPSITFTFQTFGAGISEWGEQWYYGGGADLGAVRYDFAAPGVDTNYLDQAGLSSNDIGSVFDAGTDHDQTSASNRVARAAGAGRKYALIVSAYGGTFTGESLLYHIWSNVRVQGNHGLPERGTWPAIGFFASDVIPYVLMWCAPRLNYNSESISPTSFVIPQLAFKEPTTAAEIIKATNAFHLYDWAVWEKRTFHFHQRGTTGKSWRARIAPAQLSETGPAVDRTWNATVVRYQDVDGSTRTVGPPGSNANVTDAQLVDTDPENPANLAGVRRWNVLDMGIVSTPAGAIQVGARFLAESKQLDSSGQAQLVGTVEDDKGIERPAWEVRAGDSITFVDAADTSPRRIVRSSYSHSSRTCSVDLDAPPEALSELLDRLQVSLEGVL